MNGPETEVAQSYLLGKRVVSIEQPQTIMHLIDDRVVLVEYRHGVMVNREVTRQTCDLLEQQLPGDYSWVINRTEDYTIALVETYGELNTRDRLKRIAVVSYRKLTDAIVVIEKELCQKELSVFNSVEAALAWADGIDPD